MTMTAPSPTASPDAALDAALGVPVRHYMLRRWWGTQHVVEAGLASGPTIVLLHGWPENWYAWRHVIRALASEARLIAIDTRGFGWSEIEISPATEDSIAATNIAHDVIETMDELGVEHADLAGHDWGGWFAFRAAIDNPERFSSLLAMAIMPPWLEAHKVVRRFKGLAYLLPMGFLGNLVALSPAAVRSLQRVSTASSRTWATPDGSRAQQAYTDRITRRSTRLTTRWLYAHMVRFELRAACGPRPPELRIPTTVQLGDCESISHFDVFRERNLPGEMTLETVARCGHWVLDEAPEPVVNRLREAITRSQAPPSGGQGSPTT